MKAMSAQQLVCELDDIDDGATRGFEFGQGNDVLQIIVVRRGMNIYAYKNSCPHTGVSMDWVPDQFLDRTEQYIQCSVHGALFRIEDGYCIQGPCIGNSLTKVRSYLTDNKIICEIA